MRVRINGKLYTPALAQQLSLRDLIQLEMTTTELGMPVNLGILQVKQAELDEVKAPTKAEREAIVGSHPWALMLFAVNMYATRRKAGDDLSFNECLEMSPADVEWLMEGDDEEPDPTGRPPRKASAEAVKRPADRAKKSPPKASKRASTAA